MDHSHVLYDSDPHFKIDPISRNIIDESSKKVRLIQHDHNSERFTFELPQHIEGHDMSSCNLVEIHYVNVVANTKVVRGGVYTVDDLHVQSDADDTVVFSWLIPNNATQDVGQLQFLVRFSCVNETTGQVEYVWNTGIYTGINVSSGIYNSDSQSDNPVYPYNFVTTLDGNVLKFYVGSEEEYKKLEESGLIVPNCLYIVEDKTLDELEDKLTEFENLDETLDGINTKLSEIEGDVAGLNDSTVKIGGEVLVAGTSTVTIDKAGLYAVTIRASYISTSLISGVISVPDLTQITDAYLMLGEVNGVVKECIARYNSLRGYLECVCTSDYEGVDAVFTDVRLLIKY